MYQILTIMLIAFLITSIMLLIYSVLSRHEDRKVNPDDPNNVVVVKNEGLSIYSLFGASLFVAVLSGLLCHFVPSIEKITEEILDEKY